MLYESHEFDACSKQVFFLSTGLSALIGMWPRRGVSGAEHALAGDCAFCSPGLQGVVLLLSLCYKYCKSGLACEARTGAPADTPLVSWPSVPAVLLSMARIRSFLPLIDLLCHKTF
jgi:hypothetical protein